MNKLCTTLCLALGFVGCGGALTMPADLVAEDTGTPVVDAGQDTGQPSLCGLACQNPACGTLGARYVCSASGIACVCNEVQTDAGPQDTGTPPVTDTGTPMVDASQDTIVVPPVCVVGSACTHPACTYGGVCVSTAAGPSCQCNAPPTVDSGVADTGAVDTGTDSSVTDTVPVPPVSGFIRVAVAADFQNNWCAADLLNVVCYGPGPTGTGHAYGMQSGDTITRDRSIPVNASWVGVVYCDVYCGSQRFVWTDSQIGMTLRGLGFTIAQYRYGPTVLNDQLDQARICRAPIGGNKPELAAEVSWLGRCF